VWSVSSWSVCVARSACAAVWRARGQWTPLARWRRRSAAVGTACMASAHMASVRKQPTRFRRLVNVCTQQQPIVRHRILSGTLKVLKSASGRIHGMLPWPVRGRPQDGHRWRPVREKLHRFHFINKSLRNTIFAESNNRYTFSSCALPIFKSP
jgi:hypothetical protein